MNGVCRLCAKYSSNIESVFALVNGRLLLDMITIVCPIKIKITDDLPQQICKECMETVIASINLRETCILSDMKFRSGNFVYISEDQLEPQIKHETSSDDDAVTLAVIEESPKGPSVCKSLKKTGLKRRRKTFISEFMCLSCDKYYHDAPNYKRHFRNIHQLFHYRPHPCSICKEGLWSEKSLRLHTSRNHHRCKFPKFECDICGLKSHQRFRLEEHIITTHRSEKSTTTRTGQSQTRSDLYIIDSYSIAENEAVKFPCPVCSRNYTNEANLRRHVKTIHKMNISIRKNIDTSTWENEQNFDGQF